MTDATPANTERETESLESLQSRHRKEQRDLVSRITQKKKQASKKTRKAVNDECERLERELKERQEHELAVLSGDIQTQPDPDTPSEDEATDDASNGIANLTIAEPTTLSAPSSTSSTPHPKKPNRAKARLARRAADQSALIAAAEREAANAPDPRTLERERMAVQLQQRNLAMHEIRADGHCLYAAVADQLMSRELDAVPKIAVTVINGETGSGSVGYKNVRYAAADWIQGHGDDFVAFMEDPLPEHVRKIRETGEWGGHLELLALARTYGVRISVLHSDGRVDRIEPEEDGQNGVASSEKEEIWLGYYKHSHGLGEHYNSLRKAG